MTIATFSPKNFTDLSAAVAAIGDLAHVNYMATIKGRKDTQQFHAEDASDFEFILRERDFSSARGDTVQVWLPQEASSDMVDAS